MITKADYIYVLVDGFTHKHQVISVHRTYKGAREAKTEYLIKTQRNREDIEVRPVLILTKLVKA